MVGKDASTAESTVRVKDIRALNEGKKVETEHVLLDRVYFWIIDRYTKNNHEFKFSDQFVWKGATYVIPETFGYMVFFGIFLLLAKISFAKYGDARTIVFFMLLILWRMNVQIKLLSKINKKF